MWCVWKILKTKYCVGLQHGHTITFMFSIGMRSRADRLHVRSIFCTIFCIYVIFTDITYNSRTLEAHYQYRIQSLWNSIYSYCLFGWMRARFITIQYDNYRWFALYSEKKNRSLLSVTLNIVRVTYSVTTHKHNWFYHSNCIETAYTKSSCIER